MENVCEDCGFEVASMTAEWHGPSKWSYPDECPECGADL